MSTGAILDANNRMSVNRGQLQLRHDRRHELRMLYLGHLQSKNIDFYSKQVDPEKLRIAKEEIKLQIRKDRKREVITAITLFALLMFLSILIMTTL